MATFLIAVRNAQLDAENARTLARIALEVAAERPEAVAGATAAGDERKLRGIPALGRGVQGAIPGSEPGRNLR
jgi:hypothetical protein